jgi:hypothetical protein
MNIEINENKTSLFDSMRIYSAFTVGLEMKNFNKTRILEIIDDFSNDFGSLVKFKDIVTDSLSRYWRLIDFCNFKRGLQDFIDELCFINKYIDEKIKIYENEIRYYLK